MKYWIIVLFFFSYPSFLHGTEDLCATLKKLGNRLYAIAERFSQTKKANNLLQDYTNKIRQILATTTVPEENLQKALFLAAAYGNKAIISLLLNIEVSPNTYTTHQQTPLMYAALYGNIETTQTLLEYKARVSDQDIQGRTANDYTHLALANFGSNSSLKIFLISILRYGPGADPFQDCRYLLAQAAQQK